MTGRFITNKEGRVDDVITVIAQYDREFNAALSLLSATLTPIGPSKEMYLLAEGFLLNGKPRADHTAYDLATEICRIAEAIAEATHQTEKKSL